MRFRLVAGFVGFALLGAVSAEAQDVRDTFEYWDTSGNGDLTCPEALRGGGQDGLKLPAYRDDRDGTGLIYEWLERSRSGASAINCYSGGQKLVPEPARHGARDRADAC